MSLRHSRSIGRIIGCIGASLLIWSLPGCTTRSRWADLKIEALADVEGRPVRASTLWRVRTKQVFPPGARFEGSGVALVIPVAPGRYVYGLFRGQLTNEDLAAWDLIPATVDVIAGREGRLNQTKTNNLNYSETHDRVIDALRGRDIEICRPYEGKAEPETRCLIFVYFADPTDPATLKFVIPGVNTDLGGRSFRLRRVSVTYREPGQRSMSYVAQLPPFVRHPDGRGFGILPEDLNIAPDRPLTQADFWRKP